MISDVQKKILLKCKESPYFFLKNFAKVRHSSAGILDFNPWPYQISSLDSFTTHTHNIVRKCRQAGFSKIAGGFIAHNASFIPYSNILIVSKKDDDAKAFLRDNVLFIFDNLPTWMKNILDIRNRTNHSFELANGSRVTSLTSSVSVLRSHSASLVVIDEAAFIQGMADMWASGWSCIAPDTLLSTSNGLVMIGELYDRSLGDVQEIDIDVCTQNSMMKSTHIIRNGVADTFIIETEIGDLIEGTGIHRVKVVDANGDVRWKTFEDITSGDILLIKSNTYQGKSEEWSDDFMYFAGVASVCADRSGSDSFDFKMNPTKFNKIKQKLYSGLVEHCQDISFVGTNITCEGLDGLFAESGVDVVRKNIPKCVLTASIDKIGCWLGGIFDAVGSSKRDQYGVIYRMVIDDKKFAKQLQTLLISLGIIARVRNNNVEIYIKSHKAKFNSICKPFLQESLKITQKPQKCSYTSRELFHPVLAYQYEQEVYLRCAELGLKSSDYLARTPEKLRIDLVEKAIEELQTSDTLSKCVDSGFHLIRVTGKRPSTSLTYDLHVPIDNHYIANNLISHNTLQHGGRSIIISTYNGIGDWYYENVEAAKTKSGVFNLISVDWWDMDWVVEYKDPFTKKTIKINPTDGIRPTETDREREIYGPYWSPWLEKQLTALKLKNELWRFDQEILARPVGSGKTVIGLTQITCVEETVVPPSEKITGTYKFTNRITGDEVTIEFETRGEDSEEEGFYIWERPVSYDPLTEKPHKYVIGVDTATGKGDDYHTCEVIDLDTKEQVAEFKIKCIPRRFTPFIYFIGALYNNAVVSIERNNGGDQIIDSLYYDYGYTNLWCRQKPTTNGEVKYDHPGFSTSESGKIIVKNTLINNVGHGIDGFLIRSKRLLDEIKTFVKLRDSYGKETGKIGAEPGHHDDLVMAYGICLVAAENPMFYDEDEVINPYRPGLDSAEPRTGQRSLDQYTMLPYIPPRGVDGNENEAIMMLQASMAMTPINLPAVKLQR